MNITQEVIKMINTYTSKSYDEFPEENTYTNSTVTQEDRVNHPSHYTWLKDKCGIEVIDITRHMNFNRGNAIKYILRANHKTEEGYDDNAKAIEDLQKAIWYLNDEINRIK